MIVLRFSASMALAIILIAALPGSTPTVSGCDRKAGDYWAYDLEMVVEEVPVTGTVRYDFFGQEPAPNSEIASTVDVLRVSGQYEGEISEAISTTSAAGVLDGWSYRITGAAPIVREETTTIVNLTYTVGTMTGVASVQEYDAVSFSPPLMSGFYEESAVPGRMWNETVEAERTYSFDNGSASFDEEFITDESYTFLIESANEPKETPAGEFACVVVNMSYDHGYEVIWHSPDLGMPVSIERYEIGASEPCYVVLLSEHSAKDGRLDPLMLLIYVGIAISAFVLLGMVVLVMKRSRMASIARETEGSSDERAEGIGSTREDSLDGDDNAQ